MNLPVTIKNMYRGRIGGDLAHYFEKLAYNSTSANFIEIWPEYIANCTNIV